MSIRIIGQEERVSHFASALTCLSRSFALNAPALTSKIHGINVTLARGFHGNLGARMEVFATRTTQASGLSLLEFCACQCHTSPFIAREGKQMEFSFLSFL